MPAHVSWQWEQGQGRIDLEPFLCVMPTWLSWKRLESHSLCGTRTQVCRNCRTWVPFPGHCSLGLPSMKITLEAVQSSYILVLFY